MQQRSARRIVTTLGALGILGTCFTGPADAAPITYGAVRIWEAPTPGATINSANQQALPTNPIATPGHLVYSGTYTSAAWGNLTFFASSGSATIAAFLASGGGSFSPSISGLTQTISASNFSRATVMDFAFSLAAPVNMTITHDDGFSITNALNTVVLIDQSKPTSADSYTFTLGAGSYNLWYEESNGLPAELNLHVNSVPEPASVTLIGAGIAALGAARRRRSRE